jgi:hypothetical protein
MDYCRFPFDAADGPLEAIVREAGRSEAPIAHWKRRFIGEPFDPRAFVALLERLVAAGPQPAQIDPTRAFTTLAFADEMLERPELLASYASAVSPQDDASLVLWSPGVDGPTLLAMAESAIAAAGLDANSLPDILLAPLECSPATSALLSERADALLSEWPATGHFSELARFGGGVLVG